MPQLLHGQRRVRAQRTLASAWRGYLVRRLLRRSAAISRGPRSFEEWQRLKFRSTLVRQFDVWELWLVDGTKDVVFYCNSMSRACQWARPDALEARLRKAYNIRMRAWQSGFSNDLLRSVLFVQRTWRRKRQVQQLRFVIKSIHIMRTVESAYFSNPTYLPNLCNYALLLHVMHRDFDRARPLYMSAMQHMERRGPDIPFVLYAFAIFLAVTGEEEWDVILHFVKRAQAKDKTRTKFKLAETGFFAQAARSHPTDSTVLLNYAVCLQLVKNDYTRAEELYLRALQLDPHNARVLENYNFLLRRLRRVDYDAIEAWRRHEATLVKEEDVGEASKLAADKFALMRRQLEAEAERRAAEERLVVPMVERIGDVEPVKGDGAGDGGDTGDAAIDAKLAVISGLPPGWEEVVDAEGNVYYHNRSRGETRVAKPSLDDGLPAGWHRLVDKEESAFYYHHPESGLTQWTQPQPLPAAWTLARDEESGSAYYVHDSGVTQWELPQPLPEGWTLCLDGDSGKPYFAGPEGATQWERPVTAEEAAKRKAAKKLDIDDDDVIESDDEEEGEGDRRGAGSDDGSEADWQLMEDETGELYWLNEYNGETRDVLPGEIDDMDIVYEDSVSG
eukprot:PLAT9457.3.p1 GENE.PLAT9457.3~~PLAT9457.3.p1  ORF type:complete len:708 (-),score=409.35 PLAT9457.3:48-1898(-)